MSASMTGSCWSSRSALTRERRIDIGQCVKYSVEWVTWAVVIDMDEEKQDELVALLQKKSLHYIEVIPFDEADDDEEDDDDED
jgi:hypothetical protein